jgi:hypothetical protein
VACHKSAGSLNGRIVRRAYDENEVFEWVVVKVSGTPSNLTAYHGQFCFIPKEVLRKRGVLASAGHLGKCQIQIAPPDYAKEHWTKSYWGKFPV